MKFEYTGRHIEVTPALRSHVEEHFSRFNHFFDGDHVRAHVIIEVEGGKHRSEIVVNWMKDVLTAQTTVDDMYQSLSQTIDKIEKQARRMKKKIIDKSHKAKKVSMIIPEAEEIILEPDEPHIVSIDSYAVKPMTAEEAAMRLEDEEDQFLVFRNAETDGVSVIYKRKNGNYGLIEP